MCRRHIQRLLMGSGRFGQFALSDGRVIRTPDPNRAAANPVLTHASISIPIRSRSLNNEGHNYFLSQNPYTLNSYAAFGEAYYNVLHDLKLTAGLRWTDDQKHFIDIPSELARRPAMAIPSTGVVNQQWDQFTGRAAANWTPKLDFTDQTLDLWLLCARLQGRRRQSAGRRTSRRFGRHGDIGNPDPSADVQAGIHRCVRAGHEEHAARRRADAERRCLLLQLRELSDFGDRRSHGDQSAISMPM